MKAIDERRETMRKEGWTPAFSDYVMGLARGAGVPTRDRLPTDEAGIAGWIPLWARLILRTELVDPDAIIALKIASADESRRTAVRAPRGHGRIRR